MLNASICFLYYKFTQSVQPHFFIFCSKIKKIINIPVKLNFAKDCISSQVLLCNKGSKSTNAQWKYYLLSYSLLDMTNVHIFVYTRMNEYIIKLCSNNLPFL